MDNFQEIATYTSSLIHTKSVDILLNIKSSIVESIEKLKSVQTNDFQSVMNSVTMYSDIYKHIMNAKNGLYVLSEIDKNGSNQAIYGECIEVIKTKIDSAITDILYIKITYTNIRSTIFMEKAKFNNLNSTFNDQLLNEYNIVFEEKLKDTIDRFIIEANNIFQSNHTAMIIINQKIKNVNISNNQSMF
jgi:hypothetical protein